MKEGNDCEKTAELQIQEVDSADPLFQSLL